MKKPCESAALRWFDLKIRFDFLSESQLTRLLQKHLAQLGIDGRGKAACRTIATLPNATPGDFANVARQHHFQQFQTASGGNRGSPRILTYLIFALFCVFAWTGAH